MMTSLKFIIIGALIILFSLVSNQIIGLPTTMIGFWGLFFFGVDTTLFGITLQEFNTNGK